MKKILLPIFLLAIISCNDFQKTEHDSTNKYLDSLEARKEADSIVQGIMVNVYWDTVGLENAPVKILNARLVKKEYSNYKDISVSYKNISSKRISAIRFKWYGVNAFNEPADMGIYIDKGFGGGYDDDGLNPGKTNYGTWNILSNDAKKIIKVWPYEVAFEDGTKWKTTYKNSY